MPASEAAAAFWDGKILRWEAARYSTWARLNPFSWTVRRRLALAGALVSGELRGRLRVLDMGCGSGRLAEAVVRAPDRRYHGVDLSAAAVAAGRARWRGHERVSFERGGVEAAAGRGADLAVGLGLLDWLDDAELDSFLRGAGAPSLLLSFTEAGSAAAAPYGGYRRWKDGEFRARSFREAELLARLRAAGYAPARVIRAAGLGPGRLVLAEKA